MRDDSLRQLVLSAMFLALGFVLPFFSGQLPQIGQTLLPMHIPVLLCGLICGWKCGLAVGFMLPLLRALVCGLPAFYPMALAMAGELAVYGALGGWLFAGARWHCLPMLYRSMLTAMVGGRAVWVSLMALFMGIVNQSFTLGALLLAGFVQTLPGVILQLAVVPAIMLALERTHWRGRPSGEKASLNSK